MGADMQRIAFAASFDAIVCLDGAIPERSFFERCMSSPVVAADGAAVKLFRRYRLYPSVIVGDLDALLAAPERVFLENVSRIQITEQETTDFEKILRVAPQQGWKRLLIVGFQGEEPDHTLLNWSVALRYVRELELCFYDAERYGIPLLDSSILELDIGETISLIPQLTAVVTTRGFVWELQQETLQWGRRESARNLVRQTPVQIELMEGMVWLFCRARLPKAPSFAPI